RSSFQDIFASVEYPPPSPCTQGEGRGRGAFSARYGSQMHPLPNPLPEYREREAHPLRLLRLHDLDRFGRWGRSAISVCRRLRDLARLELARHAAEQLGEQILTLGGHGVEQAVHRRAE